MRYQAHKLYSHQAIKRINGEQEAGNFDGLSLSIDDRAKISCPKQHGEVIST